MYTHHKSMSTLENFKVLQSFYQTLLSTFDDTSVKRGCYGDKIYIKVTFSLALRHQLCVANSPINTLTMKIYMEKKKRRGEDKLFITKFIYHLIEIVQHSDHLFPVFARELTAGVCPRNKATCPMSLSFLEKVVPQEHCHLRSPQCFS